MSEQQAVMKIDPAKDVDGLHPLNVGLLILANQNLSPVHPWEYWKF